LENYLEIEFLKFGYLIAVLLVTVINLMGCTHARDTYKPANIDTFSQAGIDTVDYYPDCFEEFTPQMDTQQTIEGCGSIFLFKNLPEGVLTVTINEEDLYLSSKCQTYSLGEMLQIHLEVYPGNMIWKDSIRSTDYCSCFRLVNAQKRVALNASQGGVIAASRKNKGNGRFSEWITLKTLNLQFFNHFTRDTIKLDDVLFNNVRVGWRAG